MFGAFLRRQFYQSRTRAPFRPRLEEFEVRNAPSATSFSSALPQSLNPAPVHTASVNSPLQTSKMPVTNNGNSSNGSTQGSTSAVAASLLAATSAGEQLGSNNLSNAGPSTSPGSAVPPLPQTLQSSSPLGGTEFSLGEPQALLTIGNEFALVPGTSVSLLEARLLAITLFLSSGGGGMAPVPAPSHKLATVIPVNAGTPQEPVNVSEEEGGNEPAPQAEPMLPPQPEPSDPTPSGPEQESVPNDLALSDAYFASGAWRAASFAQTPPANEPGNVRELENVLERAVMLTTGTTLGIVPNLLPLSEAAPAGRQQLTLKSDYIVTFLRQTDGVVDVPRSTARILGLLPNTLRKWMKKLGIMRGSRQSR